MGKDKAVADGITAAWGVYLEEHSISVPTAIEASITAAWDAYLNEHDVSIPALIQGAIQKAVAEWFDANEGTLIDAIADRAAGLVQAEREEP